MYVVGITMFLWDKYEELTQEKQGAHFKFAEFGKYILSRKRVVNVVMAAMQEQLSYSPTESTGVYLSGCRGMGKTSDLHLIAHHLYSKGWEVYWFKSAAAIPQGMGQQFEKYARLNKGKNIAVLVDEVNTNPNSDLFTALLKDAPGNITTIGAAVSQYEPTGGTAFFKAQLNSSILALKDDDEDVVQLIEYWKNLPNQTVSAEMIHHVSIYLLKYCAGHVYPVLTFMEYFFTNPEVSCHLVSAEAFNCHIRSAEFKNHTVYRNIILRCFKQEMKNNSAVDALFRAICGKPHARDKETLVRMGWWDTDADNATSALLMSEALTYVLLDTNETPMYVDDKLTSEQNLENLIIEGLYRMLSHELIWREQDNKWPVENALTFSWGRHVLSLYRNVHLEFETPCGNRWMDFYINGTINAGLEILRNATQKGKKT